MQRAVAEEADDDLALAGALARPRHPGGDGHAAADDGVGADNPGLAPAQMHGAAAPAAPALLQPHDLRQRALEHILHGRREIVAPGVEPGGLDVAQRLREEMVVRAVRAVDPIARPERRDAADRRALLPRSTNAPGRGPGSRRPARAHVPRRRGSGADGAASPPARRRRPRASRRRRCAHRTTACPCSMSRRAPSFPPPQAARR